MGDLNKTCQHPEFRSEAPYSESSPHPAIQSTLAQAQTALTANPELASRYADPIAFELAVKDSLCLDDEGYLHLDFNAGHFHQTYMRFRTSRTTVDRTVQEDYVSLAHKEISTTKAQDVVFQVQFQLLDDALQDMEREVKQYTDDKILWVFAGGLAGAGLGSLMQMIGDEPAKMRAREMTRFFKERYVENKVWEDIKNNATALDCLEAAENNSGQTIIPERPSAHLPNLRNLRVGEMIGKYKTLLGTVLGLLTVYAGMKGWDALHDETGTSEAGDLSGQEGIADVDTTFDFSDLADVEWEAPTLPEMVSNLTESDQLTEHDLNRLLLKVYQDQKWREIRDSVLHGDLERARDVYDEYESYAEIFCNTHQLQLAEFQDHPIGEFLERLENQSDLNRFVKRKEVKPFAVLGTIATAYIVNQIVNAEFVMDEGNSQFRGPWRSREHARMMIDLNREADHRKGALLAQYKECLDHPWAEEAIERERSSLYDSDSSDAPTGRIQGFAPTYDDLSFPGYVPWWFESANVMSTPMLEAVPEIVPEVMVEPANDVIELDLFRRSAGTFAATGTDGIVNFDSRGTSSRAHAVGGHTPTTGTNMRLVRSDGPATRIASQTGVNDGSYSATSTEVGTRRAVSITPAGFVKGAVTFYVVFEGTQWVLRKIDAPEEVQLLTQAGFTVYALDVVRRNPSLIGATAGSLSSAIFFGEVANLGLDQTNLDPETKQLITQGVALTGALATGATIIGVSARFGGGVGLLTGLGIAGISAIGTALIRRYERGRALDEIEHDFRANMAEQNATEVIALFEDMKKVFQNLVENGAEGADFVLDYLANSQAYQTVSRMMGWWFFEKYGEKILSKLSLTAKEKFYDVMYPDFAAAMERFAYHLDADHTENFNLDSYGDLQALVVDSEHRDMWDMVGYFVAQHVIDPWLAENEYLPGPEDFTQEVLALRDGILNVGANGANGDLPLLETRQDVETRRTAEGRADRLYDDMTKDLREPSRFFPGAGDLGATFWAEIEYNLVSAITIGDRSDTEKTRILRRFYDDVSENLEARGFYNGPFTLIEASTYGHYLDRDETDAIKAHLSSFEARLKAFERTSNERYIDSDSTNPDSVFYYLRHIAEIFQANT